MSQQQRESATPHYVRSHGLGNDYLAVDPANLPSGVFLNPATVRLICDRHYGVGSDGILELLGQLAPGEFNLRIWNPDGSTAEKSGNGLRIFARFLFDYGYATAPAFMVHTPGGDAAVQLEAGSQLVTVGIGQPTFGDRTELQVGGETFAVTVVSVGNPHCVIVVPNVAAVDLAQLGPQIECHPTFPERTNVQFATPISQERIQAIVWERGAGITLASGSSASAVAAACHRQGLTGPDVTVAMPGGELRVQIALTGELTLTGAVEEICSGQFSGDFLTRLRALSPAVGN